MRATVFHGTRDVRIEDVPDPCVQEPTDAVVRVVLACICGSDLWAYRGVSGKPGGLRIGHEFLGVVDAVGAQVSTVRVGQLVLSPFMWSDGTCEYCRSGLHTSCPEGGFWGQKGSDGGQGEALRVPHADGTLVGLPEDVTEHDGRLPAVLTLADVMSTGHHAARAADVRAGATVAVVGDGAVGLCAVLAAVRLGAARIVAVGHHPDRLALARRFGATDEVDVQGDAAVAEVLELTGGGAHAVLECVGTQPSLDAALHMTRDGGAVGFVGVPHQVHTLDVQDMFGRNVSLRGGIAPARAYIPALLPDVLSGKLDPSPVLDCTVGLDGIPAGYAAMDERRAVKVLMRT